MAVFWSARTPWPRPLEPCRGPSAAYRRPAGPREAHGGPRALSALWGPRAHSGDVLEPYGALVRAAGLISLGGLRTGPGKAGKFFRSRPRRRPAGVTAFEAWEAVPWFQSALLGPENVLGVLRPQGGSKWRCESNGIPPGPQNGNQIYKKLRKSIKSWIPLVFL